MGYYNLYQSDIERLARKVLEAHAEDWMPEGDAWEALVSDFAKQLDGAIEDRAHEWLVDQERAKAERAMAAAEAVVPRGGGA